MLKEEDGADDHGEESVVKGEGEPFRAEPVLGIEAEGGGDVDEEVEEQGEEGEEGEGPHGE